MAMSNEFMPSIVPPDVQGPNALWFVFSGYNMLVRDSGGVVSIPVSAEIDALNINLDHRVFLGRYEGRSCYAAEGKPSSECPQPIAFQEIRSLYERLGDRLFEIALLGLHLVEWDKACQCCSRCGAIMKPRTDVRAKECDACGKLDFPRLSPAIIVLVEKEGAALLARSPRFAGQFFSVLAGFVEPGESLEEAVRREVKEETGISVKNVNYFGSQPWPFPDSLMIGFTAEYESGVIRVDGEEIIEAGWYKADSLPRIPGKLSIAWKLIDWFVSKQNCRG